MTDKSTRDEEWATALVRPLLSNSTPSEIFIQTCSFQADSSSSLKDAQYTKSLIYLVCVV